MRGPGHALEFGLLGPLKVIRDGEALSLGGRKPRSVLAILLIELGHAVPADVLIDALWGERPPATARKSLQTHVWKLRKILEPDDEPSVLVTRGSAYELRAAANQVDAQRFERSIDEARRVNRAGDQVASRDLLAQALTLWRGPALADLRYEPFAQSEILRLEDLRFTAIEDKAEIDLSLGRHADVIGELRAAVAEEPLRERLWELLALALHRSGRSGEALASCREAAEVLDRELGVTPGPDLQRLEGGISRQDPTLDWTPPGDFVRPGPVDVPVPTRRPFIGRHREVGRLRGAFDRAYDGAGGVVVLTGEAGIGKTRLIRELGPYVRMRGGRMLVGSADDDPGSPPYGPVVQVLRSYAEEVDDARLRDELADEAAEIIRLLPEVGRRLRLTPPEPAPDPERARYRLFEGMASFLRHASSATPLVAVVDDLHRADPSSLELFRHLAQRSDGSRALLTGIWRTRPTVEGLSDLLAELARTRRFELVELGGLDRSEVAELLRAAGILLPVPDTIERLHRRTGGNPFFLTELMRMMIEEGRLADGPVPIPATITAAVAHRLRMLPEGDQDLLALAAVAGNRFELGLLAELADRSDRDALEAVELASDVGLLEEDDGVDRFRFAHPIVRETLLSSLSRSRRARLHTRAATTLERRRVDDPESVASELAFHFLHAADVHPEYATQAVRYALLAADRARAASAWSEAADLYEHVLDMPVERDPSDEADLRHKLGVCRRLQQDPTVAGQALLAAFRLYDRADDAAGMSDVALEAVRGPVGLDEGTILDMLDSALDANRDAEPEVRARLLIRRAGGLQGYDEAAEAAARGAAALARRHGLKDILAQLADRELHRALHEGRFDEARRHATEARRLAAEIDDPDTVAHAMVETGSAYLSEGDIARARRTAAEAHRYAVQHDIRYWEHDAAFMLAVIAALRADRTALERHIDHLATGATIFRAYALAAQAELAGDLDAAERIWSEVPDTIDLDSILAPLRSWYFGAYARLTLANSGSPQDAAVAVAQWAAALEETPPGMFAAGAMGEVDRRTADLIDDELARDIYQRLTAYPARVTITGRPLDPVRGHLALRTGLLAEAERHFRMGLAWAEREDLSRTADDALQALTRVAAAQKRTPSSARQPPATPR